MPARAACADPVSDGWRYVFPVIRFNQISVELKLGRGVCPLATGGHMPIKGRALIVEDDVILGWALERALYKGGFHAVKLVVSVDQALEQLRYGVPDIALLDLRLRGGKLSLPVADALNDAGVPFVFLTGHSRDLIPERYRGRPFLAKPAFEEDILDALRSAMAPVPTAAPAARPGTALRSI